MQDARVPHVPCSMHAKNRNESQSRLTRACGHKIGVSGTSIEAQRAKLALGVLYWVPHSMLTEQMLQTLVPMCTKVGQVLIVNSGLNLETPAGVLLGSLSFSIFVNSMGSLSCPFRPNPRYASWHLRQKEPRRE